MEAPGGSACPADKLQLVFLEAPRAMILGPGVPGAYAKSNATGQIGRPGIRLPVATWAR